MIMTNRFVIDTNVLIGALLFKSSVPFRAMELAERQGIILYSEATLKELERVLNRPKFDKYLEPAEKEIFLQKFITVSLLVNVTETIAVCRDEKDNKFLEVAVSGHANIIITGDLDLLELNPFQSIEILTPDRFVDKLAR